MQFSGNCKGKPLFWANFGLRAPWPKSWIRSWSTTTIQEPLCVWSCCHEGSRIQKRAWTTCLAGKVERFWRPLAAVTTFYAIMHLLSNRFNQFWKLVPCKAQKFWAEALTECRFVWQKWLLNWQTRVLEDMLDRASKFTDTQLQQFSHALLCSSCTVRMYRYFPPDPKETHQVKILGFGQILNKVWGLTQEHMTHCLFNWEFGLSV